MIRHAAWVAAIALSFVFIASAVAFAEDKTNVEASELVFDVKGGSNS